MPERPFSPRLIALGQALESAKPGTLDDFWLEVVQQGTPLVEPIAGDDRHVLVTFLWRASEPVENVLVIGGPGGWDLETNRMSRLEEFAGSTLGRGGLAAAHRALAARPDVPSGRRPSWTTWPPKLASRPWSRS